MICPECGKQFENLKEFADHIKYEGINFQRLINIGLLTEEEVEKLKKYK
jgi:biotin synthase-like enzyme